MPSYFAVWKIHLSVLQARIWSNCSNLINDLFNNHIRDNPLCSWCNETEDGEHYLFHWNKYRNDRHKFFEIARDFQQLPWFYYVSNIVTRWVSFSEKHLQNHKLQLSKDNMGKYFCPNVHISGKKYVFPQFTYTFFKVKSRNCKWCKKYIYLGQNTFPYCSWITVVLAHINFLSKIHPVCHNIANGIKPGSKSKTTDKHAAECSKAVCWGVKWYVWDV